MFVPILLLWHTIAVYVALYADSKLWSFAFGFNLPKIQAQDHRTSSYGLYWIQHQNDPSIDGSHILIITKPSTLFLVVCRFGEERMKMKMRRIR